MIIKSLAITHVVLYRIFGINTNENIFKFISEWRIEKNIFNNIKWRLL